VSRRSPLAGERGSSGAFTRDRSFPVDPTGGRLEVVAVVAVGQRLGSEPKSSFRGMGSFS
jgi:hypothetical protein